MSSHRRLLHYVLKIGQRTASIRFFRDVLGMHVLRHEEFAAGCQATCNGPYDGRWSKTMIGYGPESDHFVLELTYNYGIGSYRRGNDLIGVTVIAPGALDRARALGYPAEHQTDGTHLLVSPDGYRFFVAASNGDDDKARVTQCSIACSQLSRSVEFWSQLLGLRVVSGGVGSSNSVRLSYDDVEEGAVMELVSVDTAVDRGSAFGRTAIAWPTAQLEATQATIETSSCGCHVQTKLVQLDTPGKASVHVVIAADPDAHEVCLVGAEGFAELAQVDPQAVSVLEEAVAADKSDQWFASKGGKQSG